MSAAAVTRAMAAPVDCCLQRLVLMLMLIADGAGCDSEAMIDVDRLADVCLEGASRIEAVVTDLLAYGVIIAIETPAGRPDGRWVMVT